MLFFGTVSADLWRYQLASICTNLTLGGDCVQSQAEGIWSISPSGSLKC